MILEEKRGLDDLPPKPPQSFDGGEKEAVVDEQTSDISIKQPQKTVAEKLSEQSIEKTTLTEHLQRDAYVRQSDFFSNLRRRIDAEMFERRNHLKELERDLQVKHKFADKKVQELEAKEQYYQKHLDEKDELTRLRHELEDKNITILTQKERLEEVEQELEKKRLELHKKENELAVYERKLHEVKVELDKERMHMQSLSSAEHRYEQTKDDMIEKTLSDDLFDLQQRYKVDLVNYVAQAKKKVHDEKKEEQKEPFDVKSLFSSEQLHIADMRAHLYELIRHAYSYLSHKDMDKIREVYTLLKTQYQHFAVYDTNKHVYNQIVQLHDDIIEAVNA